MAYDNSEVVGRLEANAEARVPRAVDDPVKRAMDVTLALLALIFFSPLLLLISLAIMIESPGPVLFSQARGGLGGRPFRIFKFRTMRVAEDGPEVRQATRQDPRVTRLGAFLRKTSLDELPQLINVLLGDMSLVGPRPHALCHDLEFAAVVPIYANRAAVRPGLTGLAQVSGCRGEVRSIDDVVRRVQHDVAYIDNWSLGLDLRILAATCVKVFFDDKAY
jgi:putative colanic acid biosysnthesis UDP-glucose lipid carrier transferase